MDLQTLDRSKKVKPLLVRLYDSQRMYALAKNDQPLATAELTSAVCDLFDLDLNPREQELVSDVLMQLMRQAETDLKQALSERLSTINSVPLRLAIQIANDDINVARPMLKNSTVLGDLDLIYIIKSKGAEYWQAIAARKQICDQVMNLLSATADIETALTLVENDNIHLTEHSLMALSEVAQRDERVAIPLLRRNELGNDLACALYQYVGEDLKSYITENYTVSSRAMNAAVDELVLEFAEEASYIVDTPQEMSVHRYMPTTAHREHARQLADQGDLTAGLILSVLKRGQIRRFIAGFSLYIGQSYSVVIEILEQPSGQKLAVACRANNILKPDFVSIFLMTNRVRDSAKMVDVRDINRAVEYYNRVSPDLARQIMSGRAS